MQVNKIVNYSINMVQATAEKKAPDICTNNNISKAKHLSKEACDAVKARVRLAFPPKTEQELTAIKMNQQALNRLKNGINTRFPHAIADDIKILKNNDIRKYIYQNPNSGNLYHLINKGTDENGNVTLRILDSKGAFVKEATIEPKTVAIIDNFTNTALNIMGEETHGSLVQKYMEAYNPCLKINHIYEHSKKGIDRPDFEKVRSSFEDILQKLNSGEKIDYVNCSFSSPVVIKQAGISSDIKMGIEKVEQLNNEPLDLYSVFLKDIYKLIQSKNTRILHSAGNDGRKYFAVQTVEVGAEGVGALAKNGNIAKFSGSRFYKGAQHYEQGVFDVVNRTEGLNITGTSGIDIKYPKEFLDIRNNYKDLLATTEEVFHSINYVDKRKYLRNNKVMRLNDYLLLDNIDTNPRNNFKYYYKGCIFDRHNFYFSPIEGTSFSTPIRTAKLALHDSLKDILP